MQTFTSIRWRWWSGRIASLSLSAGVFCRIKAYRPNCNYFWGRKINLSRISPAKRSRSGPNLVYVDMSRGDNVHGILGAIGPFWAKWGLGRVKRSSSFLCDNPKSRNPERHFRNFHFRGHLPRKSEIENQSNRHLTQSRLQIKGCTAERYSLLHVVVQGAGSFKGRSTFL